MSRRRPRSAWQDYDGINHGHAIRARFDSALRTWSGRPTHPLEIRVVVRLGDVTETALPTDEEEALLAPFEALVDALSEPHAARAGTITSEGLRVYVAYAASADWLEPFQRALRERLPERQVSVTAAIDPPWTLFRAFVEREP